MSKKHDISNTFSELLAEADAKKHIDRLYGVKPQMSDNMDYENHIGELAHKDSLVLFQTYDKINGLVETDTERQKIIVNILNKKPNSLFYRKYAQEKMLKSLIRVANDMDFKHNDKLRILADNCINISKQAFNWDEITDKAKEFGLDLADVGIAGGAGAAIGGLTGALLGGLPGAGVGARIGLGVGSLVASIAKTSPAAKSVSANCTDTLDQLKDLIKKYPAKKSLQSLEKDLVLLKDLADTYTKLADDPSSGKQEEANKVISEYLSQMAKVKVQKAIFLANAKKHEFDSEHSWLDKPSKLFHIFVDDDVQDVEKSLNALEMAIHSAEDGINSLKEDVKKAQEEATAKAKQVAEELAKKTKSEEENKKNKTDFTSQLDKLQTLLSDIKE